MRLQALVLAGAFGFSAGAAESFTIRSERVPEIVLQDEFRPFVLKAAQDVAGDLETCLRHLDDGRRAAEERDALAKRYCHGKWAHWFDRSILYPYGTLAALFEQKRTGLEK